MMFGGPPRANKGSLETTMADASAASLRSNFRGFFTSVSSPVIETDNPFQLEA
jgi:hypothetical protein